MEQSRGFTKGGVTFFDMEFSVQWSGPGYTPSRWRGDDDDSWLFISGSLLINNGNTHAPSTTTGTVSLTAGLHQIEIDYFDTCDSQS